MGGRYSCFPSHHWPWPREPGTRLSRADQRHSGAKAGLFGGVALFTVIYYASGIPRVREDILQVRRPFRSCRRLLRAPC